MPQHRRRKGGCFIFSMLSSYSNIMLQEIYKLELYGLWKEIAGNFFCYKNTRLRLAQGAEHSAARRNRQEKRQIVLISSNTGIGKFLGEVE